MDAATPKIYCIVPHDLADRWHEPLRRHFRQRPDIEVIVERRQCDRRQTRGGGDAAVSDRRSSIDDVFERRLADRRALTMLADPPALPRRLRPQRKRLLFVQRLEPSRSDERADTDRLIVAFQQGDRDAFALLYLRYFDRIFGYMQVLLRDRHEAEDATQQVFVSAFQALDRYKVGGDAPFHAWLIRIARNRAIDRTRRAKRTVLAEPEQIDSWREQDETAQELVNQTLEWISDAELLMLIERLPMLQRRVIALKFMLGFTTAEVAETLDQTPDSVRQIQSRALRFLASRLSALGRQPLGSARDPLPVALSQAPVVRARRFSLARGRHAAIR